MSDPFIAEIRVMPYNFVPVGWASCDGQLLPIAQNTALFALLGTTYGGNGKTNFALPDLRGSFAMGAGQGPGLSPRDLGQVVGQAAVALQAHEMPSHSHALRAGSTPGATSPAGNVMAPTTNGAKVYRAPGAAAVMDAAAISPAGASLPHENRQPYQALNFCIALQGIFPPRS
ncbi:MULTISPECIES: phage tail protein [unclassified Roseateles]|uniref:phage tail protein n=1 Tax=unclassified Roseateles TaxID=2626991 RepID=UPI0006F6BC71|nr:MULTISPECIES: tail fiber protein [unclassified Roseateles]KQW46370.1 phage tail protein [Pelomonas sp. Root405]KRA73420.1 phage tail protein [Pelomonas sp. Root662]